MGNDYLGYVYPMSRKRTILTQTSISYVSGRAMSQSCSTGSSALAMGSYSFPYNAFAAASSSQASQSYFSGERTACSFRTQHIDHVLMLRDITFTTGGAFPASYSANNSEPSPSPPTQSSLVSCQQQSCLDYPSVYPYGPTASYYSQNPYAYLPPAAAVAAAANGFTGSSAPTASSLNNASSASSSPTYQSIQSSSGND